MFDKKIQVEYNRSINRILANISTDLGPVSFYRIAERCDYWTQNTQRKLGKFCFIGNRSAKLSRTCFLFFQWYLRRSSAMESEMNFVEQKIVTEGKVLEGGILKVDGFLNHQLDVAFLSQLGQEIYNRFRDCGVNKVLTVEASGIGIACFAAQFFCCRVLVAKKSKPANISDNVYTANVFSFTHKKDNCITVAKEYLSANDKVLIVDDFLASGNATIGLCDIVERAGATVVGISCAVEKTFQGGYKRLVDRGYKVSSLARIGDMQQDGTISFIQ